MSALYPKIGRKHSSVRNYFNLKRYIIGKETAKLRHLEELLRGRT